MIEVSPIATEDSLRTILTRLEAILSRFVLAAVQPYFNACKDLLHDRNLIDVGIVGRFKAGKSSLLNLLGGKPVLPVGVIPVTTVITRLRYGPQELAEIHFENGRVKRVPLESVRSFVSEAENPQNAKRVASVTIELPSLKKYEGLQFVDTPGLESVFKHNTEAALDWLPKVGLAIVTISVDPPLTRADVDLIRNLRRYTPKIAILLTKADLVSDIEMQEIERFVHSELRNEFGTEFQTLFFSTRPGHEHFREALDRDLLFMLRDSHDSVRSDIVQHKFRSLLEQTQSYLSLALATADRADAERATLKARILNEKTSLESIRMELQALATECAGQTRPWILKRTEELRPELEERLTRELRDKLSGLKANLWNLTRAYEQWLHETMKREMQEISARDGDLFMIPLERARDTLSRAVQGFRDRLTGNIEQALGIRLKDDPFQITFQKPSSPDIAISNLFMFNTDLLWFVIPMTIFRPWADRHFLNKIPYETEKNLSRLASQWAEKINDAILKMQRQAENYVRGQITTIEALLSRNRSDSEEIKAALSEIDSFQTTLSP